MRKQLDGCAAVTAVTFGTLAAAFAFFPLFAVIQLTALLLIDPGILASRDRWPDTLISNLLMMTVAATCACTGFRALDGRSFVLCAWLSLATVIAISAVVVKVYPHYFFLGL